MLAATPFATTKMSSTSVKKPSSKRTTKKDKTYYSKDAIFNNSRSSLFPPVPTMYLDKGDPYSMQLFQQNSKEKSPSKKKSRKSSVHLLKSYAQFQTFALFKYEESYNFCLTKVCSFLDDQSLIKFHMTCKYAKKFVMRSEQLGSLVLKNSSKCVGRYLKIEAPHSQYFPNFETLIDELLCLYPNLVIHCELQPSESWELGESTLINSKTFDLQSLNPDTRKYEKERLHEFLKSLVGSLKLILPGCLSERDIERKGWFVNLDRIHTEKLLMKQPDYTFCIRPSSVKGSYVLSYISEKKICHSLISKWKNWYFSGDMGNVVRGVFFSSLDYLVWYWSNQGLGKVWTPIKKN